MNNSLAKLRCMTAFGKTLDSVLIFALDLNEWSTTNPYPKTHVLKIVGGKLKQLKILDEFVKMSWYSEKNDVAYCPSSNGRLLTYQNGEWRSEVICDRSVNFFDIHGFCGETANQDLLFVTGDKSLFVKKEGEWKEYFIPPKATEAGYIHGVSPSDIFICGNWGTLLLWNGTEIEAYEGPDDSLLAPLVVSDDEMLVVGKLLHKWTSDSGWEQLETPVDNELSGRPLIIDKDEFWVPSFEGILRCRKDEFGVMTKYDCNVLQKVGDAVIALRCDDGVPIYRDGKWTLLELPS